MSKFIDRAGEIWMTNEGYYIIILKYFNNKNSTIKFIIHGTIVNNVQYDNIVKGKVSNPNHRSVCDIGYLGIGKYEPQLNKKAYGNWKHIIQRCYEEKTQKINPSYIKCTMDEYWHNFQNFAEWYENKYIQTFHLDKDILFKGNKAYSPKTCCFVPREINNFFEKKKRKRKFYHKVCLLLEKVVNIKRK